MNDSKNAEHHKGPIPKYSLLNVTTPIAMYWGDNDWYTAKQVNILSVKVVYNYLIDLLQDIQFLLKGLPNIVPGMKHEVAFENWSHLDFLWGVDADQLVYKFVIDNIEKCLTRSM